MPSQLQDVNPVKLTRFCRMTDKLSQNKIITWPHNLTKFLVKLVLHSENSINAKMPRKFVPQVHLPCSHTNVMMSQCQPSGSSRMVVSAFYLGNHFNGLLDLRDWIRIISLGKCSSANIKYNSCVWNIPEE